MGCCQTNLASPHHPANINPRNFIDKIKENQSLANGDQNLINEKDKKKKTQSEKNYEYSKDGLRNQKGDEEISVSIFDEEIDHLRSRQRSGYARRKMGHAKIHPQVVEKQKAERQQSYLLLHYQKIEKKNSFLESCLQLMISHIDLVYSDDNIQHLQQHILNKQISSQSLLKYNHQNNNQSFKQTCKAIYNQTDRELVELNNEIATMIVMWDRTSEQGKRLKLATMKNQSKQNVQNLNNGNFEGIDKNLEDIWKQYQEDLNVQDQLQNQRQLYEQQDEIQNFKKQYILKPNLHLPQTNKPKNKKSVLTNYKTKYKQQQIQQNQQNKQKPHQHREKQNNANKKKQQLKLNLSKMKSCQAQQQSHPQQNSQELHQYEERSQNESQNEYSHCLLSNPSKILNDSFVEEYSLEKQFFYFGDKSIYKKWIQSDRKAFWVNNSVIQTFLFGTYNQLSLQQRQHKTTKQIKKPSTVNTFCILLSIIRDYYDLTGINLIAYRTFSSTSILMQPNQREKNYSGFRIFYNGTKRIYPFSECFDCTEIGGELWKMVSKLCQKKRNLAQLINNLTGWVPEFIVVEEINSFQGILQRLSNNFIEGNTIITFTGKQGQTWGLKSINLENKLITLYGKVQPQQQAFQNLQQFQQTHSWQHFTTLISSINVNWNPLIYQYVWRTQNIFFEKQQVVNPQKDSISIFDPNYISNQSHQYLLKIPPSHQDIELRVFLETHFDESSQNQPLVVQLYDYTGTRVHTSTNAIRKIDKKNILFSEVLIFEASKQRTQYVLLVRPQVPSFTSQLKYTISAFSFCQVGLSEIPQQRVLQQKKITTFLQESHCGYGINSPFFLQNFYMQLKLPSNSRVRIFVEMPIKDSSFEINIVANPEGQENLTRLNLETILNDIITSQEFNQGKGYLQLESRHQEYFLMLTNHTKCKGEFRIIIQVLEKQPKSLTKEKLKQIQTINSNKDQFTSKMISYKERFFYQKPLFKKQFKWSPLNTGPRKRLKSNTHSGYQPYDTFKQFFKNPYTDFKLQKGKKYQLSVISQSYRQKFDRIQNEQNKKDSQPPTLSLGILKIAKPEQYGNREKATESVWSFKIILDDAFYVPFGFGFWTKGIEFEEGEYRFVFPRMQKEAGVGVFCVYEVGM